MRGIMQKVQFITTPSGDELAVLLRTEYEALIAAASQDEDAADEQMFALRMANFQADGSAGLPVEVSAAILGGASRLKALRKWRKLSQVDLAAKAGLGQGYISDLESHRRKGSHELLATLAAILDVPPAWLH
jgi:DNA-binding XRE family transcriptional regulator